MQRANNIAIFASGSGTNAEEIIKHFKNHASIKVCCVLSDKADAQVHARAEKYDIPSFSFYKSEIMTNDGKVFEILNNFGINFIVLAGYMQLIPGWIIDRYHNSVLNIHPALLPKFGGKGMYGHHVHEAVISSGEKKSGITVHLVNKEYDKGKILFQDTVAILPDDTPDMLAEKIQKLEHEHYSKIIENFILVTTFFD